MRIGDDAALRYITRDGRVGHTWAARLIEETPHRLAPYGGSFWSYYVNLEEPFRRTGIGFDTNDHHLDIVVERDLSWRYKDERDLALRANEGTYSPQLVVRWERWRWAYPLADDPTASESG